MIVSIPKLTKLLEGLCQISSTYQLSFLEFEKAMSQDVTWWEPKLELFRMLDVKQTGIISFEDYISSLSIICYGTSEERMACKDFYHVMLMTDAIFSVFSNV